MAFEYRYGVISDYPEVREVWSEINREIQSKLEGKFLYGEGNRGVAVSTPVVDEIHEWWRPPVPPEYDLWKIRITFNRDLTWSEREHLRANLDSDEDIIGVPDEEVWYYYRHHFISPETLVLYGEIRTDEPAFETRLAADWIHKFVAQEFFNVHLKAVKTITPEVKV